MAGIQASGLGSGLDINSLVSQLVAAERAPLEQRIVRHETKVTTKISALGTMKGALAAFKASLEPLKEIDAFRVRRATADSADYFGVSANSEAATGSYDIQVTALAKAHQLASDPFLAGSTAPVGHGTLTISVGGASFAVTISQDANTLADIRDAINDATGNTGVQATMINAADGTRLVLTSTETGEDHAIRVLASGGDGGLNQLVHDPGVTENLNELSPAQDAHIRLADEFDIYSDTNTFDDAIDGVTITVKKVTPPGEQVGVNIAFDSSAVTANIQKFVTEYNKMQSALSKLRSYNAETGAAGPLLGDSMLRGIEAQIRRDLSNPVSGLSGTYTTLASIGITTTATGSLQLDTTKLSAALNADANAVAELFGSEDGVAARLYDKLEDRLGTTGEVEERNTQLNKEIKQINKDKEALTLRLTQIEARYRAQFTALDSLLTSMQSTSNYLAQQLANLPKSG